jgi:hypothetical protein
MISWHFIRREADLRTRPSHPLNIFSHLEVRHSCDDDARFENTNFVDETHNETKIVVVAQKPGEPSGVRPKVAMSNSFVVMIKSGHEREGHTKTTSLLREC